MDQVYDLLTDDVQPQPLTIREIDGKSIVDDAQQIYTKNRETAIEIVRFGLQNRRSYNSRFNMLSSRSHAILQFHIDLEENIGEEAPLHEEYGQEEMNTSSSGRKQRVSNFSEVSSDRQTFRVRRSTMTFVDLAGSERISAHKSNTKQSMMESTSINKSIAELTNCILALAKNSSEESTHVPFRNSKLTRILRPWIAGERGSNFSRTVIIANMHPCAYGLEETLSTMKFATCAKLIRAQKKDAQQKSLSSPGASKVEHPPYLQETTGEASQKPQASSISAHTSSPSLIHSDAPVNYNSLAGQDEFGEAETIRSVNINGDQSQLPANSGFNLREFLRACTIANRLSQTQQFLAQQEILRQQNMQVNCHENVDLIHLAAEEHPISTPLPRPPTSAPASTFASFPSPAFTERTLDSEALHLFHNNHSLDTNSQDISPAIPIQSSQQLKRHQGLTVEVDDDDEASHDLQLTDEKLGVFESHGMMPLRDVADNKLVIQTMPSNAYLPSLRGTLAADSMPLSAQDVADTSSGLLPGLDKQFNLIAPSASGSFFFVETARSSAKPTQSIQKQQQQHSSHQRASSNALPRTGSLKSVESFLLNINAPGPPTPSAAAAFAARLRLQRQQQQQQQQQQLGDSSSEKSPSSGSSSSKERYAMIRQFSREKFETPKHIEAIHEESFPGHEDENKAPITTTTEAQAETEAIIPRRSPGMTQFTQRLAAQTAQALLQLPSTFPSESVAAKDPTSQSMSPNSAMGKSSAATTTDMQSPGSYQSIRHVIRRKESTVQTDPSPERLDKSVQTKLGLQPNVVPLNKQYFGLLDDFDEFLPAPQCDQITQTEAIFLVSDYYGSKEDQSELTDLALLDPLEVACCFLELKKVV